LEDFYILFRKWQKVVLEKLLSGESFPKT